MRPVSGGLDGRKGTITTLSAERESRTDDEAIAGAIPDTERASADRNAIEHPVQPLRTAGSRGPVALVCLTVATLALLTWQPWSRAPSTTQSSSASQAAAIGVEQSHSSPSQPPPAGSLTPVPT